MYSQKYKTWSEPVTVSRDMLEFNIFGVICLVPNVTYWNSKQLIDALYLYKHITLSEYAYLTMYPNELFNKVEPVSRLKPIETTFNKLVENKSRTYKVNNYIHTLDDPKMDKVVKKLLKSQKPVDIANKKLDNVDEVKKQGFGVLELMFLTTILVIAALPTLLF